MLHQLPLVKSQCRPERVKFFPQIQDSALLITASHMAPGAVPAIRRCCSSAPGWM
ncbi:hypothetical protein ACLB1Q_35775 [Escherichia coli]